MRIKHKFFGNAGIEISITLRGRFQRNHCGIDDFRDRKTVVKKDLTKDSQCLDTEGTLIESLQN
jgi:hypothetical protein